MTIIAARKLIPTLGKDNVGKERVKAAAEIFKRHGASSVSYTHLTLPTTVIV